MQLDWLPQIVLIILAIIIGAGLTHLWNFIVQKYWQGKFKAVFGADVVKTGSFHLVYGEFILSNPINQFLITQGITHPYQKSVPVFPQAGNAFSISNPVSIAEVRAANYLSSVIGVNTKNTPVLSSDIEIKSKLDASFISFGGSGGNHKTNDIITSDSNQLVKVDGSQIISVRSSKPILTTQALTNQNDYGLILKINPKQFTTPRVWIMCAGFGEWGTSGAAYYLAHKWEEIYKWAGDSGFAIIVNVRNGQDESAKECFKAKTPEDVEWFLNKQSTKS